MGIRQPPRLRLEDEIRLTREVDVAEGAMIDALLRAPSALRELGSVGERLRLGTLRLRTVSRVTEHTPGGVLSRRERIVEVLERAAGVADAADRGASSALAADLVSLRLEVGVLERAAAAMSEGEAAVAADFARARDARQRARAEWALAAVPLVVAIARRYGRAGVDTSDLVQEGTIGLVRAVERFDPRLGHRFHVYAAWWIRQHVFRGLAENGRSIRLPLPIVEASRRLGRARRVLEARLGESPSDADLAAATGIDPRTIAAVNAIAAQPVSLNGRADDSDVDLLERIADASAPAPDEQVARARLGSRVQRLFDALAPRERAALSLRFGLDGRGEHSLAETAASLGVSREHARRLEERALSKLRAGSRRAGLGGYVAA
jgi:RNA polymerase sigma factor (sigma-70 family)